VVLTGLRPSLLKSNTHQTLETLAASNRSLESDPHHFLENPGVKLTFVCILVVAAILGVAFPRAQRTVNAQQPADDIRKTGAVDVEKIVQAFSAKETEFQARRYVPANWYGRRDPGRVPSRLAVCL
jgi:hypothetical protein